MGAILKRGLLIYILGMHPVYITGCDEILRDPSGTVQSPGYSVNVGNDLHCYYRFNINNTGNFMINLTFLHVLIPCAGSDQLQVFTTRSEEPITVCTGNTTTSLFLDNEGYLLFRSVNDAISVRFQAHYFLVAATGETTTLQTTSSVSTLTRTIGRSPSTATGETTRLQTTTGASTLTRSTENSPSTYDGTRTQYTSVSSSTPVDLTSTSNVLIIAGAIGGSVVVVTVIVTIIAVCLVRSRRKLSKSSSNAEIPEPGKKGQELGITGGLYSVPDEKFGENIPSDVVYYSTVSEKDMTSKGTQGTQHKDVHVVPAKHIDNKEDIYKDTTAGEYDVLHKRRQKAMDSLDDDTYDVSQRDDNPYNVAEQVSSHNIDDLYDHAKQHNVDDNAYDTTINARKGR